MSIVNHYTYYSEYSPEDGHYIASCKELPFITASAKTKDKSLSLIKTKVKNKVADMIKNKMMPPPPIK